MIKQLRSSFELYPDEYPLLVRFADERRPETVDRVDRDKLEQKFGRGVKLKRIFVSLTSDSVGPNNNEERLVWLHDKGAFNSLDIGQRDMRYSEGPFGKFVWRTDFYY